MLRVRDLTFVYKVIFFALVAGRSMAFDDVGQSLVWPAVSYAVVDGVRDDLALE